MREQKGSMNRRRSSTKTGSCRESDWKTAVLIRVICGFSPQSVLKMLGASTEEN